MKIQPRIQAEHLPIGDEPGVEPLTAHPQPALRGPRGWVAVGAKQRADLLKPLLQNLGRPGPHGQHAALLGR